jgi:hypothetical protein
MDSMLIRKDQREAIEAKADNYDLWFGDDDSNAQWRNDYSGRGMYGDNCLGVVLSGDVDFAKFVILITEVLGTDEAYDLVTKLRTDSMGYSTIYYFPGVTMEADDDAPKESEHDHGYYPEN